MGNKNHEPNAKEEGVTIKIPVMPTEFLDSIQGTQFRGTKPKGEEFFFQIDKSLFSRKATDDRRELREGKFSFPNGQVHVSLEATPDGETKAELEPVQDLGKEEYGPPIMDHFEELLEKIREKFPEISAEAGSDTPQW